MKRDEEKVTNYFFKQTKPRACMGREGREGRGEGGGINPPKNPLQLSTHENMYKCCMFKRQEPDC